MPKKGENIYKRKEGRWEGRYIKGYMPNGKAQYGYVYGKTYSETKQKLLKVRIEHEQGLHIPHNEAKYEEIDQDDRTVCRTAP